MHKSLMSEHENVRLHILAEVSQQITSILEINELLARVVRLIQQTFNYYHVGIGLIENDEVVYRVGAGILWDDPAFKFKPARLKVGSEGITGWVAKMGEPALVPDVTLDPRYVWMQGSQTRSELTVPISVKEQVIGVLDVQSYLLNDFDEADLELISSLANQTGVAIENARLYENAKEMAILEERQRLARELHDSVTQSLYGIELYSQAALGNLSSRKFSQVEKNLKDIHETSQEALAEMRLLIYELRPPILEKEGLVAVLQARLTAVEGRAGLKIEFKSELTERTSIYIEEGLYHIAQEALNNVLKHAHAKHVSVNVRLKNGMIILTITDDGVGFDIKTNSRGGLGLASMREHAEALGGKLTLVSQPKHGTRVTVEVKL